MTTYTITIDAAETKALEHITVSVQDWIDNAVTDRARIAKDEIYANEVARMTADPNITTIPADKDKVILDADIKSAATLLAEDVAAAKARLEE